MRLIKSFTLSSRVHCSRSRVHRHVLGLLFISVVTGDNMQRKHIFQSGSALDEDSR